MIGPTALLALGAVIIALALQISSGQYDPRAVALVTFATVAAVIGAAWRKRVVPEHGVALPQALLGFGCAVGLACHLFTNPTLYADPRAFQGGFRWLPLIALAILSTYLWTHPSLVRARFPLLLVCFAAMGLLVIRASPKPWIDVWEFQQGAADALLHGANPYSESYRDIYGPTALAWYAPELRHAGRVVAFPYPPLTFLAEAPAFAAFGDVRYALLASMIGAAWLIARTAPGKLGELAAALVLFQPRTLLVVEQAWTESLVLFCFALSVYAIVRGAHWVLSGAALGLLAASKQYAVLFVVPLALSMPRRRGLWVSAAVLIAVLAPFAIGDPAGFWRGVVRFQLVQPFRFDSLSLAPFAARLIGPAVQPFALAGLALGAGVLAFSLRRTPDLPLACATAAAAWAAVLIWNKQSFCNYWWLCSGLLAAASVAPAARETG